MNRIIVAAAAALAFTGIAAAQEAPVYTGSYGPAVENTLNLNAAPTEPSVDRMMTSSINMERQPENASLTQSDTDIRSGH